MHLPTGSLRALLRELIDYAGLFPPAALGMSEAVANYAAYRASGEAWMLGRFITPASRLEEFGRAAAAHFDDDGGVSPWRLSVLGGGDPAADLKAIEQFNRQHGLGAGAGRALIDAIELKASSVEEIESAMRLMHPTLAVYLEIPILGDLHALLSAIACQGARAKVRTGGLTPEAFPSTEQLARFIAACAAEQVAFKATAGLHHPLRAVRRLTYEPESASGWMHGFLNLFIAAAWTRAQAGAVEGGFDEASSDEAVAILAEESAAAFEFTDEGVGWRGRRLTNEQLAGARDGFAVAFGSCSFAEPVEDLRALGLL